MSKARTLLLAAAAALALPGAAQACPAKIGAVLSLTGSYATFGRPISDAASLSVELMNQAGWHIGGCKELTYVVRDDQTQPSVGVDAARRLIDLDKVSALVGPITSGVTGPILTSVTVNAGALVVASASSSPTFTELARGGKLNGLFYRVQPSDALQAVAAAKLAWDNGLRRIVVVNLNNDWGNNLSKQFIATFKALGGQITEHITYNAEQPSYRSEVNKALRGNPEGAYIAASPVDGAKILRDWIALGGPDKFVFPLGMNDAKLIEQVGEQYLRNAWYVTPGAPQPNSRAVFYETYERRYGLEPGKGPGPGRDSGFDAASIIALAMVAAGNANNGRAIAGGIARVTDPAGTPVAATVEGFREAIRRLSAGESVRYVGASGALRHDEFGDVSTPFVGWRVENGTFVQKADITADEVAAVKARTGT